jgi:endo-1,4-beta-xylanase
VKNIVIACVLAAVAGCIIRDSGGSSGPVNTKLIPASDVRPLREAGAVANRRMGTAIMSGALGNDKLKALIVREFDSVTPENEMKWASVEPQPGKFTFEAADRIVDFAVENKIRVRGHTLVWHSQLAPWVTGLDRDALRAAMIRHVQTVAGHWKGKIGQWDVVNEAIADGPSGELRPDSPFNVLGPTFIDEAFKVAHATDPDAQLFYNDYEIEGESAKGEAAYALVKRLKESGVPIHGIGFQMHVDPRRWPTGDQIRRNIERYAALGLLIEFTEMDVPVGAIPGSIDEKLERQREITRDIVAACVAVEKCTGITFWGVTDAYSWLNDGHWGAMRGRGPHYPLPFSGDLKAKPMVVGIVEALEKAPAPGAR